MECQFLTGLRYMHGCVVFLAQTLFEPGKSRFLAMDQYDPRSAFEPAIPRAQSVLVSVRRVQGGVQALSRSWYARLIPRDAAGEFFGFYNLLGKFAAVIGPSLMAWAAVLVGTRGSILSLLLLFVGGALILLRIPVPDGTVSTGKVE